MAYTPAQVASINSARSAAYAAGQNPYGGAGATAVSSAAGLGSAPPPQNINDPNVPYQAPMTPESLTPQTPIKLPTPTPTPITAPSIDSILASLQTVSDGLSKIDPSATATKPINTNTSASSMITNPLGFFSDYLKNIQAPAKTADIYAAERTTSGIDAKQTTVNSLTASLNSIKANADAKKLSVIGQGRGIPEAIIGGQQAQIDREAAIEALPVAAQLAAAQGDLKLAQDHLDTVFKLRSEDASNDVAYKNKLVDAVYNFADKQQQLELDKKKTENSQAFTLMTNNLNYAQTLATKAIDNGQPGIATRIAQLDPKSPTYQADISKLAGQIQVVKSTGAGSTEGERAQGKIDAIQKWFQPGVKVPGTDSVPFIAQSGFATFDGWKAAITNSGMSRADFIKQFGNYISVNDIDKYGLTAPEKKLITG